MNVVYFSNVSENTKRFVEKLNHPSLRIPVRAGDLPLEVTEPYILIVPTYGGGWGGGAVPKQVVRFLNSPDNRSLIRGVVAAGNTNFGSTYCLAGRIIAEKCDVPLLYKFELLGTETDVHTVDSLLTQEQGIQ